MNKTHTTKKLTSSGDLASIFLVRDLEWRKKVFFGGLLLLVFQPIGWPAALGFRKELIARLYSGEEPLLPEWKGNLPRFFFEGIKATGVIFGYLLPVYAALLYMLLLNGVSPNIYWLYTFGFFFFFMIFSPLSIPFALLYWTFLSPGYQLPLEFSGLLFIVFSLVVFFIPAGFLQVSKTGRYLAAFNIRAALKTLITHFRKYLIAWYHSSVMSLAGHFALPFSPWGAVWCYLGIIYSFNLVIEEEVASKNSWFENLRERPIEISTSNRRFIYRTQNSADIEGKECYLLRVGPSLIPLPSLAEKALGLKEN